MTTDRVPYSIADYLTQINATLLSHRARVFGEVTSINKGYPTAIYFSVKDTEANALLSCLIWRSDYIKNGIELEEGMEVILTGVPEIYAPNGKLSFKTSTIELAGEGKLKQDYEKLKKKLNDEGFFLQERKRTLPTFPRKIGVITSKAGVVMQDFSTNIGLHGFQILNVDSRVEGKDAIHDLHNAIETLKKYPIDVLVIIRGGGSLESLQAFNTESLVRAIAKFPCPVITGIGHDTDVTLVQMVADFAASTPTAVAKKLNEPWIRVIGFLNQNEAKILGSFGTALQGSRHRLEQSSRRVANNFTKLEKHILGIRKDIENCLSLLKRQIASNRQIVNSNEVLIKSRFADAIVFKYEVISVQANGLLSSQQRALTSVGSTLQDRGSRLIHLPKPHLLQANNRIDSFEKIIKSRDPERILSQGYSLNYSEGKLLRSLRQVKLGSEIETKLTDGSFTSRIEKIT